MKEPTLLIALTEAETANFLTAEAREQLEQLPFRVETVRLPLSADCHWPSILEAVKPDALLAAWACPRLPDDLSVAHEGGLQYVAYLAGSVKELVPRELIARGLKVTNWGNSISRTISECGLLLILSAMRRASHWSVAMHRDGAWKQGFKTVTQSLFERPIGLHGFGNISQQLVPLLKPFGGVISTFSPSVPNAVLEELGVKRTDSLEALFAENEVIVEVAAYHTKNHHIVTESLLRSIPSGGVFVNIGRGAVVDEAALIRVAQERSDDLQLGLDVFEEEPLPADSPLRGMSNVALLPHIAGPTGDRCCDSGTQAVSYLARFAHGESVSDTISTEQFDRAT
jgi:phosphoglycerate dehydrogenase-like enzyme